jgi:hypothetical protein
MSDTPVLQPYYFMAIHRDQPGSPQWFEYAMTRIEKMSARLGGNAQLLKAQIWELYAKASPLLGLWVAFKGEQPIGHLLGQVQSWDGRLVAWINQAEMDTHAGLAFKDLFITALEGWVHTINRHLKQANQPLVREIMMVTRRGTAKNFDHWSRHCGFDPYLTVYRREVHVVE